VGARDTLAGRMAEGRQSAAPGLGLCRGVRSGLAGVAAGRLVMTWRTAEPD
jgi:hypothetical protein